MNFIIKHVLEHYEAYDRNGNFIVSGDTYAEIRKELEGMRK